MVRLSCRQQYEVPYISNLMKLIVLYILIRRCDLNSDFKLARQAFILNYFLVII